MQPERQPKKLREKRGKVKGARKKPYVLEWRWVTQVRARLKWLPNPFHEWRAFGRYANRAGMEQALKQGKTKWYHSNGFEFREHPDNPL